MRMFRGVMPALALALLSAEPLSAQVQGAWTASGSMQSPRESNAA
jgi:hypothetical protein